MSQLFRNAVAVTCRAGGGIRHPAGGQNHCLTGQNAAPLCNVTNHCSPEEVRANIPRNAKFLYSALERTPPAWVEEFFEGLGVALKVERGNRVFPQSDRAAIPRPLPVPHMGAGGQHQRPRQAKVGKQQFSLLLVYHCSSVFLWRCPDHGLLRRPLSPPGV